MLPEFIPQGKIYSVVEGLLSSETLPKVKLAGRSKHFLKNWKKLTEDKKNWELCRVTKSHFTWIQSRVRVPHNQKMNTDQSTLVNQETESMLQKCAIQKVPHVSGEFLNNLFLVDKSDGGKRPVINLRNLNSFIPYQHFKMEGLHLMKGLLLEKDYMCKIDLRDAYFTIPKVQEIPQVQMGGNTVRVSLPSLWTRLSTSDIYKINESPYFSTAVPKHLPNNIPGRHVDNG